MKTFKGTKETDNWKGTKGKWEIMRFDYLSDVEFHIVSGKTQVCKKSFLLSEFEENKANAKAISALPELLEALQENAGTLEMILNNVALLNKESVQIKESLNKAKAALNKAL